MSKLPNTFDIRKPSPLNDEGTEVEVVRRRGPNSDVWSLTWDELMDLFQEAGDALRLHREEGCEHQWEQTFGGFVGDAFNCSRCGAQRFDSRL